MMLWAQALVSVLAWVGISLWTVGWSLGIAALFLVHPWLDPGQRILHRMASLWGRRLVAMAPGSRVEVVGLENIPRPGPVVFMANHQSYVDVPVLCYLPAQFKWMADADLFRIPFFGWSMGMAGYIPVRRGNPQAGLKSLWRAKGWLRCGISIFVFPEGTRSHTGVLGRFETGGFRLAMASQVPIVPVVVTGTRQLLPRGSWIFRWGVRLRIRILPPVAPPKDARSVRPTVQQVRQQMRTAYAQGLRELRRRNVIP